MIATQTASEIETLRRLVDMVASTNNIALTKTLEAIRNAQTKRTGYHSAAIKAASIAERMIRAAREVRLTLRE